MKRLSLLLFLAAGLGFVACDSSTTEATSIDITIDTLTIDRHMSILASDDFLGRKPFTEGEEKTIHYLESE